MAPIKFEENIREKLQERELQPSKEAWLKLEKQLEANIPAKKRNNFTWLAIAAGFVGVLLTVTLLFNKETPISNEMVDVEQELPINSSNPSEEIKENIQLVSEDPVENKLETTNTEELVVEKMKMSSDNLAQEKVQDIRKENVKSQIVLNVEEDVAVESIENKEIENQNITVKTEQEKFIDTKVDEVVAAVQDLEKQNAVTAEEVDALLTQAQRAISNRKILESATVKVDPESLLQDVETELERSFRDRVFDALGKGYNKIRTAVVERNY